MFSEAVLLFKFLITFSAETHFSHNHKYYKYVRYTCENWCSESSTFP